MIQGAAQAANDHAARFFIMRILQLVRNIENEFRNVIVPIEMAGLRRIDPV